MKKFFSLFAVVLFAIAANADVLFQETFCARRIDSKTGEPGSTYIDKTSQGYWPYASQWFTGYDAKDDKKVEGNQYDNDYTNVTSYSVSVRGKKLNGEAENTVGLFFAMSPNTKGEAITADKNFVLFKGALPLIPAEGAFLILDICSSESDGGNLEKLVVKVNDGEALEIPATELGDKGETSTISLPLAAGQIDSLYLAFDEVPQQKFISRIVIDTENADQAVENVVLTEKAKKVMVDGVMYIVRGNKMFDVRGTQVR